MGQITINSEFGSVLYDFCKSHPSVKSVVEIGTWDGMGSTHCIISGLSESNKIGIEFLSLESNSQMHSTAMKSWEGNLPPWAVLCHGRIVGEEDMDSSNLTAEEGNWFAEDVKALRDCPDVMDRIPERIDLLLLDGGEFTTHSEFCKLESRTRLFFLDDVNSRKCKAIRELVLSNSKYRVLFDAPHIRAGVMAFEVSA
jgi:hypothetical protein